MMRLMSFSDFVPKILAMNFSILQSLVGLRLALNGFIGRYNDKKSAKRLTAQMGLKVNLFFEIQDEQLQFQTAFEDHFGRPNEENFFKCAGVAGFEFHREVCPPGFGCSPATGSPGKKLPVRQL